MSRPSSGASRTANKPHRKEEKSVRFKSDVIRGPRCGMATCLDSEGNAILLHQLDDARERAKGKPS